MSSHPTSEQECQTGWDLGDGRDLGGRRLTRVRSRSRHGHPDQVSGGRRGPGVDGKSWTDMEGLVKVVCVLPQRFGSVCGPF